jgi:hypothetical protein
MKTVYCVQAYGKKGRTLTKGALRQFGTEQEAADVGQLLSRRVVGVVVFSVSGEPAADYWEEPRLLATHGEVPGAVF